MRLRVANKYDKIEKGHIIKHITTGQIVYVRSISAGRLELYSLPDMKFFDRYYDTNFHDLSRYEFLNGLEKAGIIALLEFRSKGKRRALKKKQQKRKKMV